MKYGVFSSVYGKYTVQEAAKKIKEAGFEFVQFIPVIEGKWISPFDITAELLQEIRTIYSQNGLTLVGIGGGFRFLAPEKKEREKALAETKRWIELAPELGTNLVVTEIGSKHPTHNWTDHPDNHTEETWQEVVEIYRTLTEHAKRYGVNIGIEPHFAAVIKDAKTLRRILDDVGAVNLKMVLDPANSITEENAGNQSAALEELFAQVGNEAVLAHAKDTAIRDGASDFVPAGRGVLPYRNYLALLKKQGYTGPLVLEYLEEDDVPATLNFLKSQEIAPYLVPFFQADPVLYENAQAALDLVHAPEGALELKYRLLLSMVADALQRHPAGAIACAQEALEAGATREQLIEAFRVVYTAGGLPALIENFDIYREVILK